ncbi:MAG: glycosyltransferase family 9 protein [Chitinophagaceae bacterium]
MTSSRQQLLVIRFSSLGDVAMTVPVLRLLLTQYPTLEITMLSNEQYAPLFSNIARLHFIGANLKERHKGLKGIYQLFVECKSSLVDFAVADFHNVLRSKILVSFFRMAGYPVQQIDKGRAEKKKLTSIHQKQLVPLASTFERYAAVAQKLGFPVDLTKGVLVKPSSCVANKPLQLGIAPFAQYREKTYPPALMKQVILHLQQDLSLSIYLYGAPGAEATELQQWEKELPGVINRAGKQAIQEELKEIASLDAMLAMDSANMHIASIFNVPVVSIWGATHPFAGFMGWQQPMDNAVQVDLSCRPCSVFGNKPCHRGDWACLTTISPAAVVSNVKAVLLTAS